MSVGFRAVQWNRAKLVYDGILLAGTLAFIATFIAVGSWLDPPKNVSDVIGLRIRAFGSCTYLMLTLILAIGPLARLDRRFLPLLYNRRHFGVLTFLVAALHLSFMLEWYIALDALPGLLPELMKTSDYGKFIGFPFKVLGIAALLILFLMAATSHDYWLVFLTPPVWKALHMCVYVAYALIVLHVVFGVLQGETSPLLAGVLCCGVLVVFGLHILAARQEAPRDRENRSVRTDGFVDVCAVSEIPEKRAVMTCLSGERVAVFRHDGRISAISNVCQHQNGPLGEGRIVNGCVVCPWHGYEYSPETGASPAPFTEKVPTYRTRVIDGMVFVHPCHRDGRQCAAALRLPHRLGLVAGARMDPDVADLSVRHVLCAPSR